MKIMQPTWERSTFHVLYEPWPVQWSGNQEAWAWGPGKQLIFWGPRSSRFVF